MIIRFSLVLLVVTFTGCVNPPADSPAGSAKVGTSGAAARAAAELGAKSAPAATSRPSVGLTRVVAADRLDETAFDHFGDGVSAKGESITIASLATKTDEWAGKKICVKFRDYGFFVPKKCEGREEILEGTYSVSKTSVAELRLEMKVMADGVALKRIGVAPKWN